MKRFHIAILVLAALGCTGTTHETRPDTPAKGPEQQQHQRALETTGAAVTKKCGVDETPSVAEKPRVYIDTAFEPKVTRVVPVAAGTSLQAALDAATCGDALELEPGATWTGNFWLRKKDCDGWIVVRSAQEVKPRGERVTPDDAAKMPKILTPNTSAALRTESGAHRYRFVGLEIGIKPGVPTLYNLVQLGNEEASLDLVPSHFYFERCYLHGNDTGNSRRGIAANAAHVAVVDSWLSNFKEAGSDSQAFASWNGPGPFKLVNNHIEAAGENVLLGGAVANVPNLVPSDVEVRGNHFFKPLTWRGGPWSVKNIFEVKNGRRLWLSGNVLENNWVASQPGFAVLFTPRGQYGKNPWSTAEDVTFENNILRHSTHGINILGHDDTAPTELAKRIVIRNNSFEDIGGPTWTGGHFLQMLSGPKDIVVDHNTIQHAGNLLTMEGPPITGFVLTNNIAKRNAYGIIGSGAAPGNGSIARYLASPIIRKNVIVGASAGSYPPDNFYPPNPIDALFTPSSFRLVDGSQYKAAGTDGKDLGADYDALEGKVCD